MLYEVKSTDDQTFLAKITSDSDMNIKEHKILTILSSDSKNQTFFPKIYGGGTFVLPNSDHKLSFIIIEMLGKTLEYYLYNQ